MSLSKRDWQAVSAIVRDKLEFEALRPGQRQALEAILEGRDTLAVLPTGCKRSIICAARSSSFCCSRPSSSTMPRRSNE